MEKLLSIDSDTLGEACGIFSGDGSLYKTARSYVIEVRGNRKELYYYTNHVKPIFEKVLSKKLEIIRRSYRGGYVIGIRSCGFETKRIFNMLLEFPIGKKSHIVKIPKVVMNNLDCWKPYIRGIFDTDGSIYLRRTQGKYRNPVIEISSSSIEHLLQIKEIMKDLGFNMWLERNNLKVRMAGYKNAERFFKEISPHNNTKQKKFNKIMG